MFRFGSFEFLAFDFGEGFFQGVAGFLCKRFDELADYDEGFFGSAVGEFPDDIGELGITHDEGKFHKDRRGNLVGVFDLRFRKCGLCAVRPLHGLLGLVDGTVLHELCEDAEDVRLVGGIHGEVWVFPIPEDSEALEGGALDVDESFCKLGAAAADLRWFETGRLLDDLEFDGQPVAVPARDERRMESRHGLGFHHHVFQKLVERSAHVDVAVRERRAIVEDVIGRAGGSAGRSDLGVEAGLFPNIEALRLVFYEIPTHREARLRQWQRILVIRGGAHGGRGS